MIPAEGLCLLLLDGTHLMLLDRTIVNMLP